MRTPPRRGEAVFQGDSRQGATFQARIRLPKPVPYLMGISLSGGTLPGMLAMETRIQPPQSLFQKGRRPSSGRCGCLRLTCKAAPTC